MECLFVGPQQVHNNSADVVVAADDQLGAGGAVAALLEDRHPAADDVVEGTLVQHSKQLWSLADAEEGPNLYGDTGALVGPAGVGDTLL